jgi:hypothetical protein
MKTQRSRRCLPQWQKSSLKTKESLSQTRVRAQKNLRRGKAAVRIKRGQRKVVCHSKE